MGFDSHHLEVVIDQALFIAGTGALAPEQKKMLREVVILASRISGLNEQLKSIRIVAEKIDLRVLANTGAMSESDFNHVEISFDDLGGLLGLIQIEHARLSKQLEPMLTCLRSGS